jgi:hypothetical protein
MRGKRIAERTYRLFAVFLLNSRLRLIEFLLYDKPNRECTMKSFSRGLIICLQK